MLYKKVFISGRGNKELYDSLEFKFEICSYMRYFFFLLLKKMSSKPAASTFKNNEG